MPSEYEIIPGSTKRYFPHGMRRDGICTAIVACYNDDHAKKVAEAFPIPGAMYISHYAAIAGRRADKIIVFLDGNMQSSILREKLADWVNSALRCRLMPSKQDEVYII